MEDFFQAENLRVKKVIILRNERGQSKGSGIVEFDNPKDADYAIKRLNGTEIERRAISIEYAKQGGGGQRQGSGNYNNNR